MTNAQTGAGMALSNAIADAVERAGQFTALVNARRRLPVTGVLYANDLVLTADHGVEREEDIQIILPDGSERGATLVGRDRGTDLALLRLASAGSGVAAQPGTAEARVGNLVVAVGRPATESIQASLGMVIALGGGLRTRGGGMIDRYLVTDAVLYPGFSGGPLIDLAGGLLGINTSGLVRGMSPAIPARLAWEVAQNLAQHGHVKRGYLGIRSQVVEIPTQLREQVGGRETGLLLVGIEADGPSAAGLMVGDILVGLNNQPVSDHDTLLGALVGDIVGRSTEAQVLRGGQLQRVNVTVGERA